jgi:transposase-like protein
MRWSPRGAHLMLQVRTAIVAESVLQLLMEADVEGLIGASRYERNGERTTWRNGYRERGLDSRLGTLQLRIPKLRQGGYFPQFLEARKTTEKALIAVIQEAWIGGDEDANNDAGTVVFLWAGE